MPETPAKPFVIFVLEDDRELGALIRKQLSRLGYQVEVGFDEKAALSRLAAEPPDLLLLDYQLSAQTGKDVVHQLAQHGVAIPFIIMTGHGDEKIAVEMMKMGAIDYLVKDIYFINLLPSVILKAVDHLATRRQLAEAQQALQKSEERFKLALEAATHGIFDWNLAAHEVYFSPHCFLMLGYEPMESSSFCDACGDLLHPDDKDQALQVIREYQESGRLSHYLEYRLKAKNNEWRWLLSRGKIVETGPKGEPVRLVGTHVDISERKQAEILRHNLERQLRQAQKMEAVGQLAGGVAHDFNNMLFIISGYAEMVMLELSPLSQMHKNMQEIMKTTERAATLVRQLLLFSRKEAMQLKILDINRVIDNMSERLRQMIGENIELIFHPGAGLETIYADPGQMEQVIMNLCANAKDAISDSGRIVVETKNVAMDDAFCDLYSWAKPGDYVLIRVADSGPGIPDPIMERIFEPFFTTKEVGKGSGLGLAAAYGIVKAHQGLILAANAKGNGAELNIYLPKAGNSLIAPDHDFELQQFSLKGQGAILVVDDEAAICDVIRIVLEQNGFRVILAEDGEQGIRLLEESSQDINLVLLDVIMPNVGGEKVIQFIQEFCPDMPVIFMSGYSRGLFNTKFISDHPCEIIQKPFSRRELLQKVHAVIANRL